MPYLGSAPQATAATFAGVYSQSFNGNGSTTTFTLGRFVAQAANIEVIVNNVQQSPFDGSYSLSGGTSLVFSEAPSSGTNNIYVVYRDYPVQSLTDNGAVRKSGDTMTGDLTLSGSSWSNSTGGQLILSNSGSVGAALTMRPTSSVLYSAGWSVYAGSTVASIGDGAIGFWDHTSQLPKFWIDNTGRMRLPYQPSFFAFHNAGDVTYTPNQVLPYQSTRHNVGGHYNTSTSTFTAPIAGTYLFSATANANSDSINTDVPRAYWQVNGSNIGNSVHFRGSDSTTEGLDQRSATVILTLAASDTVRIQVQLGRWNLFGANHFCGHLIG